jgi:hypothetical protein
MIYYLYKTINNSDAAYVVKDNGITISFIFDPANTDYANFKKEILADEAQLQDADGNVMDKAYVASLP